MSQVCMVGPDEAVPGLLVPDQTHGPKSRTPLLELVHPVSQCGLGHQHHVGAGDVPGVVVPG